MQRKPGSCLDFPQIFIPIRESSLQEEGLGLSSRPFPLHRKTSR
ncbi:hypothetical protein V2J09_022189 [Rumex salicifolius]